VDGSEGKEAAQQVLRALEGHEDLAEAQGHAEVAVLLGTTSERLKGETTGKAFRKAAAEGHADDVAAMLEGGAAVGAVGGNGYTALICAATFGHAECVRLLLEAGADASLRGKDSRTALEHAEARGHAEVVAMLRR
jgi:ankyrin repeat protein